MTILRIEMKLRDDEINGKHRNNRTWSRGHTGRKENTFPNKNSITSANIGFVYEFMNSRRWQCRGITDVTRGEHRRRRTRRISSGVDVGV